MPGFSYPLRRHAGMRGLASARFSTNPLAAPDPHFPARAKRVIFLFMNGGPSHVDTFDPKPALQRYAGRHRRAKLMTGRRQSRASSCPRRSQRGRTVRAASR